MNHKVKIKKTGYNFTKINNSILLMCTLYDFICVKFKNRQN